MARRPIMTRGRKATAVSAALESREVSQVLNTVLDRLEEDRKEELRLESKRARAESEMLAAGLERMIERHGKDHPRVRSVQRARLSMERQAVFAEAAIRRIEAFKPPVRGGWTATGGVRDATGKPMANLQVGFTMDGKDTGLEAAKTDEEGEFYATYPPEAIEPLIERKAQLTMVIRNGRTVLYQDSASFVVQPNAIRQFRVILPGSKKYPS